MVTFADFKKLIAAKRTKKTAVNITKAKFAPQMKDIMESKEMVIQRLTAGVQGKGA